MDSLIRGLLGDWGILVIPVVAGIATSFVTEFVDALTPSKVTSIPIMVSVSLVMTFLTMSIFPSYFAMTFSFDYIFWLVINFSVAFLFYKALGQWTVDLIFRKLKAKMQSTSKKV